MFIKIQKEKGFASSDSFRSLKRCTVIFVIGLFLLIASIAANIFLVSNGILWGLFFSYGIAYILIAIGFKSAGIKLLTDKGLNLKYSSINIGKILVQEIKNDSKVLEEDNFDILLELALLNNDQKKLLKLFKEKEEVNSRGLLSNFDNLIDFWAFIDQVSDQETA